MGRKAVDINVKIKKNRIKIILFIIGVIAAAAIVYLFLPSILELIGFLVSLFLPFLLGYLFSLAVNPLADMLQKRLKIPRGLSAVLVMVLIIGILGGVVTFGIWKIVDEARLVYTQFPSIYAHIRDTIHSFGNKMSVIYDNLPQNVQEALAALGEGISDRAADFINVKSTPVVDYAGNFAKALPSVFVAVIVFILSSYFMVSDNRIVSAAVEKVIPGRFAERFNVVKSELKKYLGGYCKAQVILMCISFVIIFIGLEILGINYALLIALLIAVLDALPFFGSGFVLWPWTLIAFVNGSVKLGIGLLIIYAAVTVMRRFAEPKIVSNGAGMHPILTLMSMYVGYKTLKIGGLILGPIILMVVTSFYKAGIFDGPIRLVKSMGTLIKQEYLLFKAFLIKLIRSDDEDE